MDASVATPKAKARARSLAKAGSAEEAIIPKARSRSRAQDSGDKVPPKVTPKGRLRAKSAVEETPLPKPKRRARRIKPSEEQENAKDLLRTSLRTASKNPMRSKVERFIIADSPEPQKRKTPIAELADGVGRRRRRMV